MSYGPDPFDNFRRSASYVDRNLQVSQAGRSFRSAANEVPPSFGKSLFAPDCVVGLGGLELPTKRLSAPGWRLHEARYGQRLRACDYCAGTPSIWYWRDHSTGKSVRRATPMPWGSLPSMAALTRSGARKASEIVMLIFRVLQFSRFAMLSALAVGSATSSSSQRRPRAIAATSLARVSERIGRACSGRIPSGRRISRRRLAGVFRQGTARVLGGSAR